MKALFRRIEQDQRHTNVTKILNRLIQKQLFGGSALAYETITSRQLDELEAVIDLEPSQEAIHEPTDNIILKLIKVFYESNRYN